MEVSRCEPAIYVYLHAKNYGVWLTSGSRWTQFSVQLYEEEDEDPDPDMNCQTQTTPHSSESYAFVHQTWSREHLNRIFRLSVFNFPQAYIFNNEISPRFPSCIRACRCRYARGAGQPLDGGEEPNQFHSTTSSREEPCPANEWSRVQSNGNSL